MRHSKLEDRCVGHRLPDVLVGDPAGDHADGAISPLDPVQVTLARRVFLQFLHAPLDERVAGSCVCREQHVLAEVAVVVADRRLRPAPVALRLDGRHRVADPRRYPEHHRCVESLGDLERPHREVLRLLAVRWLEDRDFRGARELPVVLLVLRRVHRGIVGGDQHQSAVDARVRRAEQRICGDIDADVLHRHERPEPAEARAVRRLVGDLLVGRPLAADAAASRQRFEDLGARGARVGGGEMRPCFEGSLRYRFVPRQQDLARHVCFSSLHFSAAALHQ